MIYKKILIKDKIIYPLMIPNLKIKRFSPSLGEFYITFSVEEILEKYNSINFNKNFLNLEHTDVCLNIKIIDSFIKDFKNLNMIPKKFHDLPNGTWFIITEYNKLFEKGIKGVSISTDKIIDTDKGKIRFYDDYQRVSNNNEFNNFYLDMKGGGTNTGRNEHGPPHVHIYEKNSCKEIGKIIIPKELNNILLRKDKIQEIKKSCDCDLSKQQINELISYFDIKKINYLLFLWDKLNKDNDMLFIKRIKKK